jgi:hypothetical protein
MASYSLPLLSSFVSNPNFTLPISPGYGTPPLYSAHRSTAHQITPNTELTILTVLVVSVSTVTDPDCTNPATIGTRTGNVMRLLTSRSVSTMVVESVSTISKATSVAYPPLSELGALDSGILAFPRLFFFFFCLCFLVVYNFGFWHFAQ